MKLFDSHCHLDDRIFKKDFDNLMQRAAEAGVEAVMIVGIDLDSSKKAVAMAKSNACFYASTGVHPHDAKSCSEKTIKDLVKIANDANVRAWGEIGLDFNRMYSPGDVQEKWFIRQLETADSLELPVIFHERDSNGRLLKILKSFFNHKRRGVVHCFSGSRDELGEYLDMGLYIGITGILTIKKRGAYLRDIVKDIPVERLLVETDAPYLTPAPEKNRTRRNEPAFVRSVLLKLAEVRKDDPESLAEKIWNNTCRLYGIDG
ncbi:TatD DNase family protein [Desulfosarcina sp. BuS5]|uniref:TatD family hydrolase n=1 Tax=Desulfosarcina sp. BuS5 TaxID=933262 RepID=UPI0004859B56|nr:TatD family hydrolase [Desulfosarcina sp. BuS5]WDN89924.1 TatD DNase family protein [Desulfosarcina sp. BuS5]